ERAAQKRYEIVDDLARRDVASDDVLAPRKRHELLDELAAALPSVARRFELREQLRVLAQLLADQVEITDEDGQQVVEVVRDAGREAAQRFHARAVLHGRAHVVVVLGREEADGLASRPLA